MTWHLPGLVGSQNSTLRQIWGRGGAEMTPFDPTGWRGLGNVSLHSFLPFLPPVHAAKCLLGVEALLPLPVAECPFKTHTAAGSGFRALAFS